MTEVDRPIFGRWRRLTHAEIIIILVSIQLVWTGYLTADIQYNRQINYANQQSNLENQHQLGVVLNNTQEVLQKQGNLTAHQRDLLIKQFQDISEHGGFATNQDLAANQAILRDMNDSFAQINLKLDKLLNQSSVR